MHIPSNRLGSFHAARYLSLLASMLLAACATPIAPHQALPDTVRDKISSSTDVVVPIKQSEIYVFVPASNVSAAAGGGLLAALVDAGIDSVRTAKAETAVKPLRDSLVDYSFDDSMRSQIADSLGKLAWIKAGSPRVVKEVTNDSLDGALAQSNADAVLFATTDYHLSNDADILDITENVSLFAKSGELIALGPSKQVSPKTAPANALYRNVLTYEVQVPAGTVDRDKNIVIWSADHGAAMRNALNSGTKKLAQLLATDLQGQPSASDAGGTLESSPDGTIKYVAASSH